MLDKANSLDWVTDVADFLKRRWPAVAKSAAAMIALGILYVILATPKFTATATLLIDMQAEAPFQEKPLAVDAQMANAIVESQLEVILSRSVADLAVKTLHLDQNQEFLANGRSRSASLIALVTGGKVGKPSPSDMLMHMLSVKRTGMSYVLEVSVTTTSAALSASLANGVASAYIDSQLDARGDNTRRASAWLQKRIKQLREQATAADRAVQEFKAVSKIVDTDKGLMNERSLGELNSQLILARSHTAETRGRYEQIQSVMRDGIFSGPISENARNDVIVHLREQYADIARQASEWTGRVGANHAAVRAMKGRMKDIEAQIQAELQRISDNSLNDYKIAAKSEADIEKTLNDLAERAGGVNDNLVTLRALQSSADTYKALYENFLQRYTQAVQDQSFPISQARVLSQAVPPPKKSSPKVPVVLAACAVLGLGIGFAISFLRDGMDKSLRKPRDIRGVLGVSYFGMLPVLHGLTRSRRSSRARAAAKDEARIISAVPEALGVCVSKPTGAYAEAVRSIRVRMAYRQTRDVKVIAMTSSVEGEGKTTFSANFAFMLAQSGFSTLLIDADMQRRSLTQALAPGAADGLLKCLKKAVPLVDAVWTHPRTGLHFLPMEPDAANIGMLRSYALEEFAELRDTYDYIVMDLPPVAAATDALQFGTMIDGYLMVIEWGRTPVDAVQEALFELHPEKVLGAVFSKADRRKMGQYLSYGYGGESRSGRKKPLKVAA